LKLDLNDIENDIKTEEEELDEFLEED